MAAWELLLMTATRRPVWWQARMTSRASGVGVALLAAVSLGVSECGLDQGSGVQVEAGGEAEYLDRVVLVRYGLG